MLTPAEQPLTTSETSVIDAFKHRCVLRMADLRSRLDLSRITVFRALSKRGYFNSFNHNGRYYTLSDTPKFDSNGLWFYRTIGFSRHGNLSETLVALVDGSSTGLTPSELSSLLRTEVTNLLGLQVRQQRLARRRLGRQTLYLTVDPLLQEQQWSLRQQQSHSSSVIAPNLPDQLSPTLILPVLLELIRCPKATIGQLAKKISTAGTPLQLQQVRAIFDFYQLEKKEEV